MTITLDLPDEILSFVASYGPTPERGAVSVIAVSLYREGKLSFEDVSCILGFDNPQLDAFLKERRIPVRDETTAPEQDR